MRELTADMAAAVAAKTVAPLLLAEFEFDSETLRFWTGIGQLQWNGNTYTGGGSLVGISQYAETQDLESQGFSFNLNGIPSDLLSVILLEPYQGRRCSLYLALVTTGDELLLEGGTDALLLEDGNAFLLGGSRLIVDPYKVFSGFMDVMQFDDDGSAASITVSAENAMIVLTQTRLRNYSAEDQKSSVPGDTGFDFVSIIQDREVIWKAKS